MQNSSHLTLQWCKSVFDPSVALIKSLYSVRLIFLCCLRFLSMVVMAVDEMLVVYESGCLNCSYVLYFLKIVAM